MRIWLCFLVALYLAFGLVYAEEYNVIINEQAVSLPAITVDGQIYIPLEVLEQHGMLINLDGTTVQLAFGPPILGGAEQLGALEGCLGQLLFNGIWRFQVLEVRPYTERSLRGWDVDVEMRNGTNLTLRPADFGAEPLYLGVSLALDDGRVLTMEGGYVGQIQNALLFRELIPGASAQTTFRFRDDSGVGVPTRLIYPMNPERRTFRAAGIEFATDSPSFRVRLDCN